VDFGFMCAREFWVEVVLSSYEQFRAEPNRANAITASGHAWHVHEWIWHEQHPGDETRDNDDYKNFRTRLFDDCPELAWIRDVADAGKHRGLGRRAEVQRVVSGSRFVSGIGTVALNTVTFNDSPRVTTPLAITLTDGSTHGFAEVLSRIIIDYWRAKYFP
jgi:hypothetical protein